MIEKYPKKGMWSIKCPQESCKVQMARVIVFKSQQEEDDFHRTFSPTDENPWDSTPQSEQVEHLYLPAGNCGCKTGIPGSRWRKQKIKMLAEGFGFSESKAERIYCAIEKACIEVGFYDGGRDEKYGLLENHFPEEVLENSNVHLWEIFDIIRKEIGFVNTGEYGLDLFMEHYPVNYDRRWHDFKPPKGSWSNP